MKAHKIVGRTLLLLILIAAVTGCIGNPVVQVYSGPKLERTEIARVTMDSTLGVVFVNNTDPYPSSTMRTMTLELLPGKYRIVLFYSDPYTESVNDLAVTLFAEAGRSYHIYSGAGGGSWDPYIVQK